MYEKYHPWEIYVESVISPIYQEPHTIATSCYKYPNSIRITIRGPLTSVATPKVTEDGPYPLPRL